MRRISLVTSIIFSKNRPLQLDLCLNSIKKNFSDSSKIVVIYRYDGDFADSITSLSEEHPDVEFYNQSDSIYEDIKNALEKSKNNYVCFFTDDNIFYRHVGFIDLDPLFNIDDICCLSLRLGYNTSKRFHLGNGSIDIPIAYNQNGDFLFISKTDHKYGSYWSYSHSVDGHIFRLKDVIEMIIELSHINNLKDIGQTPNDLETNMQRFWPISKNTIVSLLHSVVVNSPNNRVSESHKENISGEHFSFSDTECFTLYKSGKRLNIDKIDFSNIQCPHQEVDIMKGVI